MHPEPACSRPHPAIPAPQRRRLAWLTTLLGLGAWAGCAAAPVHTPTVAWQKEAAPVAAPCPDGVPAGARCLRGQDSATSHYLIVMPQNWSGVLVVHAHGGPSMETPRASRADDDIRRWAITVRLGHAWAGSVFRQGGFAVTTAAEDTERVRRIFVEHVANPRRTLLHGQSWGGMIATRAAELFPDSWEGILLTSAVVSGPANYDIRLHMRVLYQQLCGNHPRPDDPPYPVWMGLPATSKMSRTELRDRIDACLGLARPAAERSPEQARKIRTIVDVLRVSENVIHDHLRRATFDLADIVQRSGGGSPFGNEGVRYSGSADDAALNAAVLRVQADAQAAARFKADSDHAGRFRVPVLTTHGIGDSTVFVEGHDTLRQRMEAAGNGARLVQTFVDSREHSYLGDPIYPPLFEALLRWVEQGEKPTPAGIAQRCRTMPGANGAECRFVPDYVPQPLATRIPAR